MCGPIPTTPDFTSMLLIFAPLKTIIQTICNCISMVVSIVWRHVSQIVNIISFSFRCFNWEPEMILWRESHVTVNARGGPSVCDSSVARTPLARGRVHYTANFSRACEKSHWLNARVSVFGVLERPLLLQNCCCCCCCIGGDDIQMMEMREKVSGAV
jgi:hypothetical protein